MSDHLRSQDPETLAGALRRAAAALQAQPVPPLPPRLFAALQAQHPPRAPRAAWHWRPALAAAFALLLGSALLVVLNGDDRPPPPGTQAPVPAFVTVAGGQRLRQAAQAGDGQVWRVSTELPRERLAALGLPYDPSRAGERVRAELLVHASGDVLAVRVLQ